MAQQTADLMRHFDAFDPGRDYRGQLGSAAIKFWKRSKFTGCKRSREQLPLSRYLEKVTQLGGYPARTNDLAPGNTVMWLGMRRLVDMQLGFNLASKRYV